MSRSLDPAFYELRTKPLPTLPERRRIIRERLAKAQAELDQFSRLLAAEPHATSKATSRARAMVRTKKYEVSQLTKALAYLGQPHPRWDLYRLFGLDLPELPKEQLPLPLPSPKPKPHKRE